ncbi:hypothetical protein SDC9_211741 [bioreactor metagenome]|uniref:Uncharacterized protein n=1 Tax=bioreactor metagenome TaxID=1076179 RepID=A0A645JL33_9ZZZZ
MMLVNVTANRITGDPAGDFPSRVTAHPVRYHHVARFYIRMQINGVFVDCPYLTNMAFC